MGQSENRWWIPWWNQLRTWRCNNVYFHFAQHFIPFTFTFLNITFTSIFSFLDSCSLKSLLFLSILSLNTDWSQIKGGCLQLILNYFKLFLLLPGEEVRNLRPVHPLSTHTQTNISRVNHKPIYPASASSMPLDIWCWLMIPVSFPSLCTPEPAWWICWSCFATNLEQGWSFAQTEHPLPMEKLWQFWQQTSTSK